MRDLEMWLAMHDDCPWPGCGQCHVIDIEMSEEDAAYIRRAAAIESIPEDVFLLRAVHDGMRMVFAKRGIDIEDLLAA